MSIIYAPGLTSKSIVVQIVDDTGLGVSGLAAAGFPTVSYWIAGANAAVTISLNDLAAITTAYNSGGVKELSGGYYRLDIPDLALASPGKVKVFGEATGKHLICEVIDVGYVQSDARQWLGTGLSSPAVAGIPDINVKNINNVVAATPGASGGLFIAGSNAATTISGLTTGALACTTITASGAVAFQSTFAVTTSTSLAALSCTTLTASGAVAFQSTFATTGTATFNALTVTNATTLSGAVSLGSTLGVTGAVTFTAGLTSNITGNLSGSVGSVTNDVGGKVLGGGAGTITATGAWALNAAGAALATSSAVATLQTTVNAVGSNTNIIMTTTAAIQAKTDNLPSDPADESLIIAATDAIMSRLGAPVSASISADIQTRSTYAGGDTSGTTTLLGRVTGGPVALASQIPANFTAGTFASAGVFSVGALANAPGGGSVTVGGYVSGQDPATLLFAAEVEAGVTFLQATRAWAADAGGNMVESSDHTTTAIAALGNPSTPRLASVNTATTRTVTATLT